MIRVERVEIECALAGVPAMLRGVSCEGAIVVLRQWCVAFGAAAVRTPLAQGIIVWRRKTTHARFVVSR